MNDKEKLKDLENQRMKLSKEISRLYAKQRIEEYKSHEKYVGKCYKHKSKNKYYRVLSNYSTNSVRLTCLTFNLDNDVYKCMPINDLLVDKPINISIDFEIFDVEDVFAFGISSFLNNVIEISKEEFDIAQQKMIDKFIKETEEVNKNINNMINESRKYYLKEK